MRLSRSVPKKLLLPARRSRKLEKATKKSRLVESKRKLLVGRKNGRSPFLLKKKPHERKYVASRKLHARKNGSRCREKRHVQNTKPWNARRKLLAWK